MLVVWYVFRLNFELELEFDAGQLAFDHPVKSHVDLW